MGERCRLCFKDKLDHSNKGLKCPLLSGGFHHDNVFKPIGKEPAKRERENEQTE